MSPRPPARTVLLITDLPWGTDHSAVEGLFRRELGRTHAVEVVFHDANLRTAERRGEALVVPKRALRHGLARALGPLTAVAAHDVVIVRNKYPALKQVLNWPRSGKVGFWESFPHTFRRLEEARLAGRSVWRKLIEFKLRERSNLRLLQRADFFLPITERHLREFYPTLRIPHIPMPMGVDESSRREPPASRSSGPLRFVYTGTIDALRRVDKVHEAFAAVRGDFVFDYYTFSEGAPVAAIRARTDPRFRLHAGLPRRDLFTALAPAHVGICILPELRTYIGSSPTKTAEFAALGLTVLGNPLPDYAEWLDDDCAFFSPLEVERIRELLLRVLAMPRPALLEMGTQCSRRVWQHRSYRVLAQRLARFLDTL